MVTALICRHFLPRVQNADSVVRRRPTRRETLTRDVLYLENDLLVSFFRNKLLHALIGHGSFSVKSSRRMATESLKPDRTRALTSATMGTLCVPRLPLEPARSAFSL